MKHAMVRMFVVAALLATLDDGQSKKAKVSQVQTSFCEGDAGDNLPPPVLAALTETKEARDALEGEKLDPSTLFKGTKIGLSNSADLFFLVQGSPPMTGADNTWFWIARLSGKRASILLFAGAYCIQVSTSTTRGYKDLVTTWSSASETVTSTYAYNGISYKLRTRRSRSSR